MIGMTGYHNVDFYLPVDFYAVTPDGPDYIDTLLNAKNVEEIRFSAKTLADYPLSDWNGFPVVWVWDPANWSGRILCGL